MSDQPDITVTDAGAPAGHVLIRVDHGEPQAVPQGEARQYVADAVSDAK